jgi:hypothetical protein
MLTTTELIAGIQEDYANSFSVDRLVRYLDRIQRTIFLDDTFELMYFNDDDPVFPLPVLPTVDGQLSYEVEDGLLTDSDGNPLNFTWDSYSVVPSKVAYVLVETSRHDNPFVKEGTLGYGLSTNGYDDNSVIVRGRKFYKARVRLTERTPSSPPRITFATNPGDTDVRYYVGVGVVPPKIGSVRTPMSINVDKWEMALIDGVVGECEKSVNGESKRAEKFLSYWLPAIRSSYNDNMGEFFDTNVSSRRFG